jgi:hypothetical protein
MYFYFLNVSNTWIFVEYIKFHQKNEKIGEHLIRENDFWYKKTTGPHVFGTIQRCHMLPLWKLTMKNKRFYCILLATKVVVLKWWALETWVNPNKADVTRKKLEVGMFKEKPTHFLMET